MKKFLILLAFLFSVVLFARNPQNNPPAPTTPSPPPMMPIDGFVFLFVIIALVYSFLVLRKMSFKNQ